MASTLVKALSILVCLVALMKSTKALSCAPCNRASCPRGTLTESDCPFGVVKTMCRCCDTCAKGLGEKCGGRWDMYGKCGLNFTCTRNYISDSSYLYFYGPGICA